MLALLDMPPEHRDHGLADAMFEAVLGWIVDSEVVVRDHSGAPTVAIAFAAHIPEMPALTDAERTVLAEWVGRSIDSAQDS